MRNSNTIRRILLTAAIVAGMGAIAFEATAGGSPTSAPALSDQGATVAAPAPAPVPVPAPAPAADPATIAEGQAIAQASCVGRCHGSKLLDRRYSAADASVFAPKMGAKVGLSPAQEAALVAYFAQ